MNWKHKRRSVERLRQTTDPLGYGKIYEYALKADNPRDQTVIIGLFLTGFRASEFRWLQKNHFIFKDPEFIEVTGIRVLKQKKEVYRRFPIERNKLSRILEEYVLSLGGQNDLLFPSRKKEDYPITRQALYYIVTKYSGGEIWPHRLRSEIAQILVFEKNFGVPQLMKYMGWRSAETAMKYVQARYEDLKKAMRD